MRKASKEEISSIFFHSKFFSNIFNKKLSLQTNLTRCFLNEEDHTKIIGSYQKENWCRFNFLNCIQLDGQNLNLKIDVEKDDKKPPLTIDREKENFSLTALQLYYLIFCDPESALFFNYLACNYKNESNFFKSIFGYFTIGSALKNNSDNQKHLIVLCKTYEKLIEFYKYKLNKFVNKYLNQDLNQDFNQDFNLLNNNLEKNREEIKLFKSENLPDELQNNMFINEAFKYLIKEREVQQEASNQWMIEIDNKIRATKTLEDLMILNKSLCKKKDEVESQDPSLNDKGNLLIATHFILSNNYNLDYKINNIKELIEKINEKYIKFQEEKSKDLEIDPNTLSQNDQDKINEIQLINIEDKKEENEKNLTEFEKFKEIINFYKKQIENEYQNTKENLQKTIIQKNLKDEFQNYKIKIEKMCLDFNKIEITKFESLEYYSMEKILSQYSRQKDVKILNSKKKTTQEGLFSFENNNEKLITEEQVLEVEKKLQNKNNEFLYLVKQYREIRKAIENPNNLIKEEDNDEKVFNQLFPLEEKIEIKIIKE